MFLTKKEEGNSENTELFASASTYISDELSLIQDQQENVIHISEELEKAFSQSDKMKKLQKIVRKVDEVLSKKNIVEKRKQESRLINIIEDIKKLMAEQKYEDIERLMLQVQKQSQLKISLSRDELNNLKFLMDDVSELYKQAVGLCRLYNMVYGYLQQITAKCEDELSKELIEEAEFGRAGSYTKKIQ